MIAKILFAIVAAALVVAFVAPVIVKLKDPALTIVAIIGIAMMAVDLWQSFKAKED